MLNIVQIMDDEICKNQKKVAVHCHAGLGRTGVAIASYLVYSNKINAGVAIQQVRAKRPKALLTNKQCEFIQEFQTFLGQLRLTFPIGTQKIEYSDFLKRQKMILRGKEAIKYKSIPKFLELFVNRIFKETDLGFKNIDDFLVLSKGIDISDERSLLNNQDFKFIEIAKPIKLFTIIDSWLRSLDVNEDYRCFYELLLAIYSKAFQMNDANTSEVILKIPFIKCCWVIFKALSNDCLFPCLTSSKDLLSAEACSISFALRDRYSILCPDSLVEVHWLGKLGAENHFNSPSTESNTFKIYTKRPDLFTSSGTLGLASGYSAAGICEGVLKLYVAKLVNGVLGNEKGDGRLEEYGIEVIIGAYFWFSTSGGLDMWRIGKEYIY
ncbi:Protein-tyrosine phosphatase domain-containing protein [Rozella allomycis CSF55]|uniref:Protein-tyrosine phosphatase domain-containing protein n=1 Tax=Rozella allomycis (strain CSF55) TaxID=988480 RepID=A0A075AN63_ROZAC|nr:Protein-tyrosine phosphatase domain-containing protein [Rozella allomycis CSF55]|eukprot:EPZ31178.1 Protein-tyrosine phosphatase domain-containing protein [Rozella allomycis CSF55]